MQILWTLLLVSVIWAEEQYFPIFKNSTWDEARLYCQYCFKELTTVTSGNVHYIVRNLTSEYWIGLRETFNGSIPWSRWSNEDPVIYQNWYPGHPVPNKEKKASSTCSATTQSPLSTPMTSTITMPVISLESQIDQCPVQTKLLDCLNLTIDDFCVQNETTVSSTPPPSTSQSSQTATSNLTKTSTCNTEPESDPDEYIADSCVALLNFGMWKEKQCAELLPFFCYDDRFFGGIEFSNVTENNASLNWTPGPGTNISHYRVEITGNTSQTFNKTILSTQLENLTPGTQYRVQVFPVKCGRDLNPQNVSFYTKPSPVDNLIVVEKKTNSILLSWSKPKGGYDFYSIQVSGKSEDQVCMTEQCNIKNLTAGTNYIFTVFAVVNKANKSMANSISSYTMPFVVSNLISADNDSTVIYASWTLSEGNHSGYCYCLSSSTNCTEYGTNCTEHGSNCSVTTETSIALSNKISGTKYSLCVAALTDNNFLQGEFQKIEAFTRPETPEVLELTSHSESIKASWTLKGTFHKFNVSIFPADDKCAKTTDLSHTFTGLKAGVNYTITVVTLSEKNGLTSGDATQSIYTKPTSPRNLKVITLNSTFMHLSWEAPPESKNASGITYEVTYDAPFWKDTNNKSTTEREITFDTLKPGTRYYFNVSVVAGNLTSDPVNVSASTLPNKKKLTLIILCTSTIPHECGNTTTQASIFTELTRTFNDRLNGVHWNLRNITKVSKN